MTSTDIETLLQQAKALPEPDRARLAHDLLTTLDGMPDSDAGAAWEREIARRLTEVENGVASTISRETLNKRLNSRTE